MSSFDEQQTDSKSEFSTTPDWAKATVDTYFSKGTSPPSASNSNSATFQSFSPSSLHPKNNRNSLKFIDLNEFVYDEYNDVVTLSENHLFRQILFEDASKRQQGIEQVVDIFKYEAQVAAKYLNNSTPEQLDLLSEQFDALNDEERQQKYENLLDEDEERKRAQNAKYFLECHRHILARFAYECPFADVRKAFSELVDWLGSATKFNVPKPVSGFLSPPSLFFSPTECKEIELLNQLQHKSIQRLFEHFFLEDAVVSHLPRVLAVHPDFMEVYYLTYNFIMKEKGPLPHAWRNYIAIMAAARHNCTYLARRQQAEFYYNGGDEHWLNGVHEAPQKIQNLLKFNALLAHQPWQLDKNHVEELLYGNSGDVWSVTELVHAITIMCHFHALSGFVYGLGILQDDDETPLEDIIRKLAEAKVELLDSENRKLVENLKKVEKEEEEKAATPSEIKKPFNYEKISEELEELANSSRTASESSYSLKPRAEKLVDLKQFLGTNFDTLAYKDFDIRSREYKIAPAHEYNWQEHTFSMVNRFYSGAAEYLDSEFKRIYSMTDNQVNQEKDVDTTSFRESIWYYVNRVYGFVNEDFDYKHINLLLNKQLKNYIKLTACYPERIQLSDYLNIGFNLLPREKIHINLLAMEARKQVSLVYALRAVERFYSMKK